MKFKEFYKIYERAYHGSVEKIKGPFSYDKIGSGHGAQAFGYGFYFSEARSVASSYVANSYKASYRYRGKDASYWYDFFSNKNDYGKAEIWESIMLHKNREHIRNMLVDSEAKEEDFEYLSSLPDNLFAPAVGGLYEVELDTIEDELLQWREPLSIQSDFIKDKLKTLEMFIETGYYEGLFHKTLGSFDLEKLTGETIYHSLSKSFSIPEDSGGLKGSRYDVGEKAKSTSLLLRELGIKGNSYKAISSRDDYRNIVMFSPNDISVINEL
jgi:hypothetical protein